MRLSPAPSAFREIWIVHAVGVPVDEWQDELGDADLQRRIYLGPDAALAGRLALEAQALSTLFSRGSRKPEDSDHSYARFLAPLFTGSDADLAAAERPFAWSHPLWAPDPRHFNTEATLLGARVEWIDSHGGLMEAVAEPSQEEEHFLAWCGAKLKPWSDPRELVARLERSQIGAAPLVDYALGSSRAPRL